MKKSSFKNSHKALMSIGFFGVLIGAVLYLGGVDAGTQIAATLNLSSAPGGINNGLVGHWTFDGEDTSVSASGAAAISSATYDSVTKSITAQDNTPGAIAFKSDGTKMYVTGAANNSVFQYSLSSAWDLSTASYDSVSKSVATEDATPIGIAFKSDGTKMYLIGFNSARVYQYTLPTPWVLTGASYDTVFLSVSPQDSSSEGLAFKSDGTKMYVTGGNNDTIYQYTLPTPWVLTAGSYDSVSKSVAAQSTAPSGLTFNSDGTKMYFMGVNNDTIFQYSLSSAWDLSTATYDSVSKSVTTEDSVPLAIAFKSDATKMYMVGTANDSVYQYSLAGGSGSTAIDKSTGSHNATLTGTAAVRGTIGQALSFDGTDDIATIGDIDAGSTLKTITFWMKAATTTASHRLINIDNSDADYIETTSVSAIAGNGFTATSVYVDASTASATIPDRGWHFVAVTFSTGWNADNFQIGTTSDYYGGAIDDVRAYNRILSADEVKQLYQLGATSKIATTPIPSAQSGGLNFGLLGYWTFDGKDMPQGQVYDTSGSGFHGSQVNMATSTAYARGPIGQSIKCDGSNDTIRLGSSMSIPADVFSFSAWIKVNTFTGTDQVIFASGATPNTYWGIMVTGSGNQLRLFDDGAGANVTEATPLNAGQWYHIVAVKIDDSGTSNGILYINGVEEHVAGTTYGISTSAGIGRICSRSEAVDLFFNGQIDDARVYNRALSADEAKQLYQLGATTKVATTPTVSASAGGLNSSLAAHWTFDGKNMPQGQVNDISGSDNHGSQVSMSTSTAYGRGAIGQALNFDGVNDVVSLGTSPQLTSTSPFSAAFWANLDDFGSHNNIIGFRTNLAEGFCIFISAASGYEGVNFGSPTLWYEGKTTGDISSTFRGAWRHVALSYNGASASTASSYTIYVDGAPVAITASSAFGAISNATALGSCNTATANFWLDGEIDDMRVYSRVLSADEVKQLYQMGK